MQGSHQEAPDGCSRRSPRTIERLFDRFAREFAGVLQLPKSGPSQSPRLELIAVRDDERRQVLPAVVLRY